MKLKILIFFLFFLPVLQLSAQMLPFSYLRNSSSSDPCDGTPTLGTTCTGGSIYAGQFDGGKYMVTPGGCTDSGTPTCAGGTDTVNKSWHGSTGSHADIAGVENVASNSTPSSSSFRGHVNTPAIVADASISSDSAADFCNDMNYGGYTDWYLPSKSELAYIYCHASASNNPSFPQEDPACTGYGGKTSELTGFAPSNYWSSTEVGSVSAWKQAFVLGPQSNDDKFNSSNSKVRCVRRY